MAKFIGFLSGKGGVGKTTAAVNISAALAKKNEDVVLVDADLSAPSICLHLSRDFHPYTIHDVLMGKSEVSSSLYPGPHGLQFMPGDKTMTAMKVFENSLFNRKLLDLHVHSDYVFLDLCTGVTDHFEDISKTLDEAVIVTDQSLPSVIHARKMIDYLRRENISISGVVVNKYRATSYRLSLDAIKKHLDCLILGIIPEDKRFLFALKKAKAFYELYPRKKTSKEFSEIASKISGVVL